MSNKNKIFNEKIEEALNNKDFSKLNKILNETVSNAFKVAQTGISKFNDYLNSDNIKKTYIPAKDPKYVLQKLPIETKSTLYKVLGYTGFSIHTLLGIIFFLVGTLDGNKELLELLSNWVIPALIISYIFINRGNRWNNKVIRFKKYMRAFGNSTICSIKDLSSAASVDTERVINDFKFFIKRDYLKEARFIENNSYIVLDANTYNEYEKSIALKNEFIKNSKNDINKNLDESDEFTNEENNQNSELLKYKKYREEYITKLNIIENKLIGEMKNKVAKLILIVNKIFEFNEKNPETIASTYKFIDYYLPTTVKILESYIEFNNIDPKGENIIYAMNDIENSMDTIILALSNFLNNLYMDSTIDIQTDISVLKTVLSQDGLLEKDFNSKK